MRLKPDLLRLEPCLAPAWARSGHAQTILGHIIPSPKLKTPGQDQRIELSGGDASIAHVFRGSSSTVVYLFHGLGGYSHAFYMQRTALVAMSLGHTVILANHRGCGAGEGLAKEPYHSGRAEDLSAVVEWGRGEFKSHFHLAIGFSLSGNAVLLLAAAHRGSVLPDAAIAVNAPINLERASCLLHSGLNRIYDWRFMAELKTSIRSRREAGHGIEEFLIPWAATVHDFDDLYTARAGGFENREHYYSTCSARQFLSRIEIPTAILTAQDDPFVAFEDYQNARYSPLVHLHSEPIGGHMGYLSRVRTPFGTKRWLDYAMWSWIQAMTSA